MNLTFLDLKNTSVIVFIFDVRTYVYTRVFIALGCKYKDSTHTNTFLHVYTYMCV